MREIKIIGSKSDAHRAMVCAALSELTSGKSCLIECSGWSKDIEATKACLSALAEGKEEMRCGESGSTLRFLLPVMGALGHTASFYSEGRLPQRPLSPLYEELISHGCTLSPMGQVPLTISGQLKPGYFRMPGNVSSQYISGLLFALPLLKGGSRIVIEGGRESKDYIEMTLHTLKKFGIHIITEADGYTVPGGQSYFAPDGYRVEGDWSGACFWLAAGALVPGGICVKGLNTESLQGDKEILRLLRKFGAGVHADDSGITVTPGSLWGIDIDAAQIPDMVPVLAVLGCAAKGKTIIRNAGRLRIKESDRLSAVTEVLNALGAKIEENPDGLIITGLGAGENSAPMKGGVIDSRNDHRIAMMAAIVSLICREEVTINGAESVQKSYPDFFLEMERLKLSDKVICKNEKRTCGRLLLHKEAGSERKR